MCLDVCHGFICGGPESLQKFMNLRYVVCRAAMDARLQVEEMRKGQPVCERRIVKVD